MRESRTYGSVRGALSNECPYRDRFARNDGALGSRAQRGVSKDGRIMKATRLTVAVAIVVVSAATAFAASDAPPGASSCSGCHAASAGVDTPVPPLNGRNAADIVTQMEAFRSGQKAATVMDRLAKGFSEAEVQAIAAWYAAQK
jgi:sulfide dehydrogenase cytochrome subunit